MHRRLGSEGEHNTAWLKNSVCLGLQMQGSGERKLEHSGHMSQGLGSGPQDLPAMTAPGYSHPFWRGEKHWRTVVVTGEQPREARQGTDRH